ncbi:MAG: hypothetical protein ACUVWO_06755 [Thermodesulfobacteriota bacterium]
METPEEILIQRLLEDIMAASRQVYFGWDGTFTCFSDGRFLERADSLPPAIDQLRYPSPNTMSTDMIRKMIPQDFGKSGEIPGSVEEDGKKYKLLCKKYTCVVDGLCFNYLKIRYPEAQIYCLGRNKPVIFLQANIVRAVLMPIRT